MNPLSSSLSELETWVERQNQWRSQTLNLIASENVMSKRARALLNSDFTHRYAEGHPGERYYEGTQYIDAVESQTKIWIKQLFGCTQAEIRTISGTNANEAVFTALVLPKSKEKNLWGNTLCYVNPTTHGGHISHQKIGALGKVTKNIHPLPVLKDGFHVDVPAAKDLIYKEKPRIIVLGRSLILFPEPVRELAPVCHETDTTLLYDGAHVLGLIAGKQFQDPLAEGAQILMGSTHKTFFGPQRGVILSNSDDKAWQKIDKAAFPGSTSNHHLYTLPPLGVATLEMLTFGREYAGQVVRNAQALAQALHQRGFDVCGADFGYTQSHQVAVNVRTLGGGAPLSKKLRENDMITNMNSLPGIEGESVVTPSGLRLGVQEMTRFGMKEPEMEAIADLFKNCLFKNKNVQTEVHTLRQRFPIIQYSFDSP